MTLETKVGLFLDQAGVIENKDRLATDIISYLSVQNEMNANRYILYKNAYIYFFNANKAIDTKKVVSQFNDHFVYKMDQRNMIRFDPQYFLGDKARIYPTYQMIVQKNYDVVTSLSVDQTHNQVSYLVA